MSLLIQKYIFVSISFIFIWWIADDSEIMKDDILFHQDVRFNNLFHMTG